MAIDFEELSALDWQPVNARKCCGLPLEVRQAMYQGQISEYVECLNCGHFEICATSKEPVEIAYK